MKEFNEANILIENLQEKIDEIKMLVQQEREKYEQYKQNIMKSEEDLNEMISEKAELEDILKNCSIGVCRYKLAFEEIKKRHSGLLQEMISGQSFHFFMSFRKDYHPTVIEDHKKIIEKNSYCWWGKFYKKRIRGGDYKKLEPFEESIKVDDESNIARKIQEKIRQRIKNGESVYLYNYCPNPPNISLSVCNVVDFYYGPQKLPYEGKASIPPECSGIPKYYFHKRENNCSSCTEFNSTNCKLKFLCNFWFKVDDIFEIKNVKHEFQNLDNCFTNDIINYAVPIFYPLLVKQRERRDYFPEKALPIRCDSNLDVDIPNSERGHTKIEKVINYFNELNKFCGFVFRRVEARKGGRFQDEFKVQRGDKNDEIVMILPSDFSRSGNPFRYVLYLHENTKSTQKVKVEKMIEKFFT